MPTVPRPLRWAPAMIAVALKLLVQHGMALLWASGLLVCCAPLGWSLFETRAGSQLVAATSVIYYGGPAYIAYVCERLVATDPEDGTSEFLDALPMTAAHRVGLPFVFGLVALLITSEAVLLLTAAFASRLEGLPLVWLLQVHWQVLAYLLPTYAVMFAIWHLGRFRWLVAGLSIISSLFPAPGWGARLVATWLWTAPLAMPLEYARSAPPWGTLVPAVLWIAIAAAVVWLLGVWRAGALTRAAYRPSASERRSEQLAFALAVILLLPMLQLLGTVRDGWSSVPALGPPHAQVRVVGARLEPVARDVAAALSSVGEALGGLRWEGVVLVPFDRGHGPHVRRQVGAVDARLVLLVDPDGPRAAIVREIMHQVLRWRAGDLDAQVPDVAALLRGAPGFFLPHPALERRLALLGDGRRSDAELVLEEGEWIAEAVAVARLRAWEAREPGAVAGALTRVVGAQRGSHALSLLSLRVAARGLGAELDHLFPAGATVPLPAVTLGRRDGLWAGWGALADPASLEVRTLDPLQPTPLPGDATRWLEADEGGRSLPVFDGEPLAVRLLRYEPAIEGWLCSPWTIRSWAGR